MDGMGWDEMEFAIIDTLVGYMYVYVYVLPACLPAC